MMNPNGFVDFAELKPRTEIELLDEEAEVLLESARCPGCNHLSLFHQMMRIDGVPLLACRFTPEKHCNCGGNL